MTISVAQKSAEAFRTISEVAEALKLPQHVLRFWETRFTQIKPLKRAGGRRFYRPEDVELLGAIRQLLYGEGYTIKGVQRILKEQGPRAVALLARQHARPDQFDPSAGAMADDLDEEPGDGTPDGQADARSASVAEAIPAPLSPRPAAIGLEQPDRMAPGPLLDGDDPIERLRKVLAEIDACRDLLIAARGAPEAG